MSVLTDQSGVGYKLRMTPTILTIVIAASAFILSIFAANWLNLRNMDKLFERLDKQLAAQFGEVRGEIAALRAEVITRLDALEDKVNRLDRQMEAIFKPILPKS